MAKPRGRPFEPGNTFGPGRPPGSRNRATRISQDLLAEHAGSLTKKTIVDAMHGNPVAQRLVMERVCPVQRDRTVEFALPPVNQITDFRAAASAITQAVSAGELTPSEGQKSMAMLEHHCDILLKAELEPRVREIEKTRAEGRPANSSNRGQPE